MIAITRLLHIEFREFLIPSPKVVELYATYLEKKIHECSNFIN